MGAEIAPGRTVVKALGGGRRYHVHLVWDERLFALMVAKLIRPDQVEDERALRELRQEADALDQLAHPVLVRGSTPSLDGPHPHLLIEHLEGPDARAADPPARAASDGAADSARPAHRRDAPLHGRREWVHLDVKPDNIVMGIPPRLIDLSIARPFERAKRLRGSIGTDAYMPPEQCDADAHPGEVGAPSDVWGLGATLYHAIAGRVPFPREKGGGRVPI